MKAIEAWKSLTDDFLEALRQGERQRMARLINRNFDIRRELAPLHPDNLQMVEKARAQGASAKFTGSGGAIVGTYEDDAMYQRLVAALNSDNVTVLKPVVVAALNQDQII